MDIKILHGHGEADPRRGSDDDGQVLAVAAELERAGVVHPAQAERADVGSLRNVGIEAVPSVLGPGLGFDRSADFQGAED